MAWTKRRNQNSEDANLTISTKNQNIRTLKRSAREELIRTKYSRMPIPWRSDPTWKYPHTTFSPSHSLGLPKELRQMMLLESLPVFDVEKEKERLGCDSVEKTKKNIKKTMHNRVAELSCVCPTIRVDMLYVGGVYKSEIESKNTQTEENQPPAQNRWRRKTLGRKVLGQEKERTQRPQRCWYCSVRHNNWDPICPMERENPEKWERLTRPKVRQEQKKPFVKQHVLSIIYLCLQKASFD